MEEPEWDKLVVLEEVRGNVVYARGFVDKQPIEIRVSAEAAELYSGMIQAGLDPVGNTDTTGMSNDDIQMLADSAGAVIIPRDDLYREVN